MYTRDWRERRIAAIEAKLKVIREFDGGGLREDTKQGMIRALELCLKRHVRDSARQFDGGPISTTTSSLARPTLEAIAMPRTFFALAATHGDVA